MYPGTQYCRFKKISLPKFEKTWILVALPPKIAHSTRINEGVIILHSEMTQLFRVLRKISFIIMTCALRCAGDDATFAAAKVAALEALNSCLIDVIRRFINWSWRFMSAYQTSLTGKGATRAVKKQRSHHSVPERARLAIAYWGFAELVTGLRHSSQERNDETSSQRKQHRKTVVSSMWGRGHHSTRSSIVC